MPFTRTYTNDQLTQFAFRMEDVIQTANNNICGGPCTVYSMELHNDSTGGTKYVKFWDHLSPEVGVTIPDFVFEVVDNFRHIVTFPGGIQFATGLSFAAVATGADNNAGAPGANIRISIVAKVG